jgi:hypothetical protein
MAATYLTAALAEGVGGDGLEIAGDIFSNG